MTAVLGRPAAPEPATTDKYQISEGRIYLTGVQALARVVLDQLRNDRRAGLRTAALVSGYQGSPLGGFGAQVDAVARLDPSLSLVHQPGQNEELGATAVWGSQLVGQLPRPRHSGVLGVWHGKAPGVDRAADALRHGNACGADPDGGLVAFCGDDPQCKSSTLPSASEGILAALGMPVLCPGSVQDILDFGRHAVAESRASGLWVALKVVTDVADGNGTADVAPDRIVPVLPSVDYRGRPYRHRPSGTLLAPSSMELAATLRGPRIELAKAYARQNRLDRLAGATGDAWIGVVSAGPAYFEVLEALRRLGLPEPELARRGIRLLKLGQIWPLNDDVVRDFARGLDQILVVEEKDAFIETAVRDILYDTTLHPAVAGKRDERGRPLIPAAGTIDVDLLTRVLAGRLQRIGVEAPRPRPEPLTLTPVGPRRTASYCSGCPHSRSTVAPDESVVGAGIGCHTMVILNPAGRGQLAGITQMGGEGAQWIGQAPFTDTPHMFQNLGDGTYVHSGSLAVRAAVAAGVNITFKILLNGSVAMTGGQKLAPDLSVARLVRQLEAEGVRRIVVTTDEPGRYDGSVLGAVASVRDRDDLLAAQRELAAVAGVTVLVHDQQCAAEKRRDRKRGRLPEATRRVMINERVCEGCGDCGRKSNCLSVRPVETEFGRKTAVHQASCNVDGSCVDGDCPSFVSVWRHDEGLRPATDPPGDLPDPVARVGAGATVRLSGIGGTGLVTVAQILGTAAHLDGKQVRGLDQTGLSQKGGPVVSDVRIFAGTPDHPNRAGGGDADVYLAFDLLVAVTPQNLATVAPGRTTAVVSTSRTPTAAMIGDPDADYGSPEAYRTAIDARATGGGNVYLDAQEIAERLCGDVMAANMVVLGAAWQCGLLPVSLGSIRTAIRMNGVEVGRTLTAFDWGRAVVAVPERLAPPAIGRPGESPAVVALVNRHVGDLAREPELAELLLARAGDLSGYQSRRYAASYLDFARRVYEAEQAVLPGTTILTGAVARNLHKLMAYKDEYEVARLSVDPAFAQRLRTEFGQRVRWAHHLHPPFLRALGLRRKLVLGPAWRPVLCALAGLRRLRGTPFDPFGHSAMRRLERRLIRSYRDDVLFALGRLTAGNHAAVVELAEAPAVIRGYESVKLDGVTQYRRQVAALLATIGEPLPATPIRP